GELSRSSPPFLQRILRRLVFFQFFPIFSRQSRRIITYVLDFGFAEFEETLHLFIIRLRIRSQRRRHLANIIAYLEQRLRILIKPLSIIVPVFCWFQLF